MVVFTLSILFFVPCRAQTADEKIKTIVQRFMAAWNSHDAKAFAALFTRDADVTNWTGRTVRGRDQIEESMAPLFATAFSKSHQNASAISIRFIRPDVAAVDVGWTMTGVLEKDGSSRDDRNGLLNFVMVKDTDQWEIAVMHNLDISALKPSNK